MAIDARRGHSVPNRFVPAAVVRRASRKRGRPKRLTPPRAVQSRLQTSRAGRRRVGGLAVCSDGAASKSIVPPDRREAVGHVGPTRTRRPPRPYLLPGAPFPNRGHETRRENAGGCGHSGPPRSGEPGIHKRETKGTGADQLTRTGLWLWIPALADGSDRMTRAVVCLA